jgi:hypothetical protein
MSRRIPIVLLLLSLSCFGQNIVVYGGYATSGAPVLGQPAPVYAPAMVPSNVALPGSGPPMGAPINNLNDSRTSGVVQVYTPPTVIQTPAPVPMAAAPALPSVETTAGEPVTVAPATGVPGAQLGFNPGLGKFEGAIAAQAQPAPQRSLADVAKEYRSRPRTAPRTITNENIDKLKGVQGTPAPQPPQSEIQHEMAKAAALPPITSGNAAPEAQPESPQSPVLSAQVDQQKRIASADTRTAPEAQPQTVAQSVEQEQQSTAASQLPATNSQLPLLAVLGLLVSGAGVTYMFRR